MNCPYCKSADVIKRGFTSAEKQRYSCKDCDAWFSEDVTPDIIEQNVRLSKNRQKQQDLNRIERKSFREHARIENPLIEYNKELIEVIKNSTIDLKTKEHKSIQDEAVLLVQLSDLHFNELISLPHNKYDFTIAGKRLKKLAKKIKEESTLYKVKNIFIAMTGDLMNSDRRLDEMLNQATNRSNATYLSYCLLAQFILDLNQIANIHIASVSGNESRIKDEVGYSDIIATDNYDFTILNMLKVGLGDKKGIEFIGGDPSELVVGVAGQNVLLMHGEGLETDTQKKIQQVVGKYIPRKQMIDFVVYGHVHSPYITDYSARSGSMAGSNDYNEKALFLVSKASQNIHLFFKDRSIDSKKIDLQYTNGDGYNIEKSLEAYNTKSAGKLHKQQTVYQITI